LLGPATEAAIAAGLPPPAYPLLPLAAGCGAAVYAVLLSCHSP
jgi:hypothetical protein